MAELPLHRGLNWQQMPGRNPIDRRFNFALFKLGQFPPRRWKVPAHLEGQALLIMLEERRVMLGGKARCCCASGLVVITPQA